MAARGDLVIVANQAGHEQVSAMLAAFRKFGIAEYAISVCFVTMSAGSGPGGVPGFDLVRP